MGRSSERRCTVTRRLTKAKPAEVPVGRPTFHPCWTEAKAVEMATNHLAPDAVAQAGYRIAMTILAQSAESLIRGALASSGDEQAESPAECVSRILTEAEGDLNSRLEILRAAQARVLWSAAFVHGVELPKG
jgi:hypothetical protein